MRLLPSGSTSLLIEVDGLDQVLALYAGLMEEQVDGVVDIVPAASSVLIVTDPPTTPEPEPPRDPFRCECGHRPGVVGLVAPDGDEGVPCPRCDHVRGDVLAVCESCCL